MQENYLALLNSLELDEGVAPGNTAHSALKNTRFKLPDHCASMLARKPWLLQPGIQGFYCGKALESLEQ